MGELLALLLLLLLRLLLLLLYSLNCEEWPGGTWEREGREEVRGEGRREHDKKWESTGVMAPWHCINHMVHGVGGPCKQ